MTEWRKITCEEREALVKERGYIHDTKAPRPDGLTVLAGRSDLFGEFGSPKVFTEWGTADETPVLRDIRHPAIDNEPGKTLPDRLPCEHYVPEAVTES